MELVFAAIAFVSLAPVVITWRLTQRWTWLGLTVTPKTALPYVWKAVLLTALVGVFTTAITDDPRFGLFGVACVGVAFAYRSSLLVDLWNIHRVLASARQGDRQALVRNANAAVERILRFRNQIGARYTNAVGGLMLGAGANVEAEQLLSQVPFERFIGSPFWLLLHTLALYRIKLGKYAEAEAPLDRCSDTAPSDALEREHRYFRGLIEAATGKPKRALGRMDATEIPEHDVVAAHAHAVLGREEKALEALERLKKLETGEHLVEQIGKGHGPAKALALRVLGRELPSEQDNAPYR